MLRWWDGTTWTGYTAPAAPIFAPLDPAADLDAERQAGERAATALLAGAALSAIGYIIVATTVGRFVHDAFDRIGEDRFVPANAGFFGAGLGIWELIALAGLAVQILVMIWLYRAATLARRAGLPARRDPIWAILGFIVPIVSLWFPYQVAADSFPRGDPDRRTAARWWAWTLTQNLAIVAIFIASIASTVAAVIVAAALITAPVMAAREGRRLIATVGQAHRKLVAAG